MKAQSRKSDTYVLTMYGPSMPHPPQPDRQQGTVTVISSPLTRKLGAEEGKEGPQMLSKMTCRD